MTARDKIKALTNSWLLYVVISTAISLLFNGIGPISLILTAGPFVFSVAVVLLIGRKLLKGSSILRTLLLVLAAVGAVFATIGAAKLGWAFLHGFALRTLFMAGLSAASAYLNVRSLRVLSDVSVKAHCSR